MEKINEILDILTWAQNFHSEDDDPTYVAGGIEMAAYLVSCILVQNYEAFSGGIGTCDVMEIFNLDKKQTRKQLRAKYYKLMKDAGNE